MWSHSPPASVPAKDKVTVEGNVGWDWSWSSKHIRYLRGLEISRYTRFLRYGADESDTFLDSQTSLLSHVIWVFFFRGHCGSSKSEEVIRKVVVSLQFLTWVKQFSHGCRLTIPKIQLHYNSGRRKLARFEFECFPASHVMVVHLLNTQYAFVPHLPLYWWRYTYIYIIFNEKDEILFPHSHARAFLFTCFVRYLYQIKLSIGIWGSIRNSAVIAVVAGEWLEALGLFERCLQRFSRSDTQLELWRAVKLSLERWVTKTGQRRLFKIKV